MPNHYVPNGNEDAPQITPTVTEPRRRCFITVEPALFLTTFGSALSSSVFTQLLLVRSCEVTFGYSLAKCALLENRTDSTEARELEALIQPHVTMLQMYKSISEACIPAVLSLFIGSWSDLYGRKPLIMWPLFGFGLQHGIIAILSTVPNMSPTYFLLGSIPVACSGGFMTIVSGVYSYISDTSSNEKRAFRMGMLDASIFGGFMIGTICSAPLFSVVEKYGYLTVLSISCTCSLLGFLYISFLPESVNTRLAESDGNLSSLFDFQLVVRMMTTCCKKRENYGRAIIFLMIIAIGTCIITMEGESVVTFLYTRAKFGWNLRKYTYFSSFGTLISVAGGVLGIYLFSVWLKIPDSVFACAVFITKCLQSVLFALAPNQWYMFGGCILGVFGGVIGPLCRSVLSKCVPQSDIGAVFALTSVVEALTPLAASPLYNLVYNATLLTFPGTFFVVSAAFFLLDIIITSTVVVMQRLSSTHQYSPMQNEECTITCPSNIDDKSTPTVNIIS